MITPDQAVDYGPRYLCLPAGPLPDLADAPPIDDEVVGRLPPLLAQAVREVADGPRRGAFLLSTVVAASAALRGVRFRHGATDYQPHLMAFVFGPPSAGKGVVDRARRVVDGVDALLRGPGPSADGPGLYLPANASSRALFDRWAAAGGGGLLFESEADALTATQSQDWAQHTSAWLRQAYHHEPVRLARVDGGGVIEDPALAVVLAGTPDQLRALLPSTQNGLTSRFLLYYLPGSDEWVSGRPSERTERSASAVADLGAAVTGAFGALEARESPLRVEFSEGQWDLLDDTLSRLSGGVLERGGLDGLVPSVRRGQVAALRVASVLAVVRAHTEHGDLSGPDVLLCGDDDFEAAVLTVVRTLDHLARALDLFPRSGPALVGRAAVRDFIVRAAPDPFSRADAVSLCADALGVSPRTVDTCLKELRDAGKLFHVPGTNGTYTRREPRGHHVRDSFDEID